MKPFIFLVSLCFAFATQASDPLNAKQLLRNMATSVQQRNFDASFVVMKEKGMEPYRWLHAHYQNQELELLSLLNGAGLEIVRVENKVTYFEPQSAPYSILTDSIAGPIPEVLFKDISILNQDYDFVLGGKGRIAGRPAQLVRLESKDSGKYNYWLWIDTETSLLLKAAYVNQAGELLEQLQLTHISVTPEPAQQLVELLDRDFPESTLVKDNAISEQSRSNWQIDWLPQGFTLLKADRHKLDLNNELADYYLFSDGLVEFSVFVQRPLAGKRPSGALSSGATTVYVHNSGAYDVSVVGKIPPHTARSIAESVKRAL
jgi:sigma-E factor negative regulatory protein RseB